MIKFEHSDSVTSLEINGSGKELVAEIVLEIKVIYESIREQSVQGAEMFKQLISKAITEGLPFMDDDEIDKKAEEAKREAEATKAKTNELKKELRNILNDILRDDE